MTLTRDELFARPRTVVTEPIEGLGDVSFLLLTMAEVTKFQKAAEGLEKKEKDPYVYSKLMLVYVLCDDQGARLLPSKTSDDKGDYEAGQELAASLEWTLLTTLFDRAARINGLKKDEKATETAAKN